MSITSCHIVPTSQSSSADVQDAGNRHRTHQLSYQVLTDVKTDTVTVLQQTLAFLGIDYGTPFPTDSVAYCQKADCKCTDVSGVTFQVDFTFETLSAKKEKEQENPLDQFPEISWSTEVVNRPMEKDIDGDAIQNSAKDKFDPGIEQEIYYPKLSIVRNEATFVPASLLLYQGRLNNATWLGFAAGRVKCIGIDGRLERVKVEDATFYYYQVSYVFLFATEEPYFKRRLLDCGTRYLDSSSGSGGRQQLNILVKGQPVSEPKLLDGNGNVLPVNGQPHFIDFDVCEQVNFGALNLEQYF